MIITDDMLNLSQCSKQYTSCVIGIHHYFITLDTENIILDKLPNKRYNLFSIIIKLLAYVEMSVPNGLENHPMKLDILWHTVSLGF